MSDDEFVRAFESCELSEDALHHRDHIRLAAIYVSRLGPAEAAGRFKASLRRFAGHVGKSGKYHETMTVAWMHLVAYSPPSESAKLMDKGYLGRFYSDDLLQSDAARTQFVEPDLAPLPAEREKAGACRTRVVK